MPYILKKDRTRLDPVIDSLSERIKTSGELNYTITKLLLGQNPKNYEDFNRLMGIMTSCSMEFYRRKVAKYEIEKCVSNGDVFE